MEIATGMRQAGEPSVEEILASIKQVIARDNRVEAARRDAPQANHGASIERAGDVLDLGVVGSPLHDTSGAATADDDPVLSADSDALRLNPATASAMRESLAALALLARPGAQPQIVRSGETSLEGLVRDMLRPMLAEWLDQHLPPIVDRLVAAEISRIARKQG